MLADIYSSNSDGIGAMYSTTKGLKIIKRLPKSVAEARTMITNLPTDDRMLALHFRFTTHGDTNLDNCHPYDVVPGYVAMMHNGVLHTGNEADPSRSDTYHFIQDFLSEAVHKSPELVFTDGFLKLVAEFIDNNRFVFMDGEGRISHVNKDQGIEHDGMWFSNTYAWQPHRLIPSYAQRGRYSSRLLTHYTDNDEYDEYHDWWQQRRPSTGFRSDTLPRWGNSSIAAASIAAASNDPDDNPEFPASPDPDDIMIALDYSDNDTLEEMLSTFPVTTLSTMFRISTAKLSKYTPSEDKLTAVERTLLKALQDKDMTTLTQFVKADHNGNYIARLADVACGYLDWERI